MVLKLPSPRNYTGNDTLDLDFFSYIEPRVSLRIPTYSPVITEQTSAQSPVKSRCNSSSSSSDCSYSSEYSSSTNGSISSPFVENFTSFQVIDNPSDMNTETKLVPRTRLEELEYINENIASIIEEALKGYKK